MVFGVRFSALRIPVSCSCIVRVCRHEEWCGWCLRLFTMVKPHVGDKTNRDVSAFMPEFHVWRWPLSGSWNTLLRNQNPSSGQPHCPARISTHCPNRWTQRWQTGLVNWKAINTRIFCSDVFLFFAFFLRTEQILLWNWFLIHYFYVYLQRKVLKPIIIIILCTTTLTVLP